ncbi:MAG: TolC family protein [Bacteroidales bacterium]|jgi:outer membrane protein TolC|nr:TolC family protein [Bacteroidales bacterium]
MKNRKLMKTIVYVALTALFPAIGIYAQAPDDTLKLTLDDALKIAMSENLTVQVADQEITKQGYAKKGTYASLFPQVDLTGSYQRTLSKQVMYMDGMGVSEGIEVGRDNSWSGGVAASMPLVSPSLWKSLKISAQNVELSVEKARSSRIDLIDQVKQSYYTVLLARDSYGVYKDAYDNAVRNYVDIERKFKEGLSAEYDLIRANVSVKNAEPSMYDAQNSLILANWQLKAVMGLDLAINISCEGSLSDFEHELGPEDLAAGLSLENNSSLKQLDIQIKQLEETEKMQKAQNYPTLNAQFSYMMNSTNNDFKFRNYRWDPYSYVGVSLNIPIFSGGKRNSDIKQAKINLGQLELQRTDTERNLQVSLKQSFDQMSTCIKQYHSALAGVKESEKGYEITMTRYESGEGTLLDINDSQLSMTQARLNLNQSIYNYLIAKSSLEKIMGTGVENEK